LPNFVVVHWDGKLLPANNNTDHCIERLTIVVTSENLKQLIAVPKHERSTDKEHWQFVMHYKNGVYRLSWKHYFAILLLPIWYDLMVLVFLLK